MKKIYLSFLLCVVALATGCPRTLTKPQLRINKKGQVSSKIPMSKINIFLKSSQTRYQCFAQGKQPQIDSQDLSTCPSNASWIVANNPTESLKIGANFAKRERDEAIEDGLALVDDSYETFIDDINNGRSTGSFIADVIELGTSATIGIAKGERSNQILGIALTAFRGGRKSADLNFFKDQSTSVLINKMDDNRSQRHQIILNQKKNSIDEYSIKDGIRDVVAYYNAGTLVRAFTELQKETAAKALQSEKVVRTLQGAPNPDSIVTTTTVSRTSGNRIGKNLKAFDKTLRGTDDNAKRDANETLRLIYLDLSKGEKAVQFKPVLDKIKSEKATLKADMDKLDNADETISKSVTGTKIIDILTEIFSALDPEKQEDLFAAYDEIITNRM